jgi:hypothetical protein
MFFNGKQRITWKIYTINRHATCHDVQHSRVLMLIFYTFIYYIDIDIDYNKAFINT